MSQIAFHEKARRSQVKSVFFSLDKVFAPGRVAAVAMLPSALSMSDSVSIGASWPSVWRPVVSL
jgi:hypothetical protein